MGLAEELLQPSNVRKGTRCGVVMVLASLDASDPEAADALRVVLAMPLEEMPSTVIEKRLRAAGCDVSTSTIQRHRRKACACPR